MRRNVWQQYHEALAPLEAEGLLRRQSVPGNAHIYFVLLPDAERQTRLLEALRAEGIWAVFHYVPLHLSAMGLRFGGARCPVTEEVSDRLVRLPFYNSLTEDEQLTVIDAVKGFQA